MLKCAKKTKLNIAYVIKMIFVTIKKNKIMHNINIEIIVIFKMII